MEQESPEQYRKATFKYAIMLASLSIATGALVAVLFVWSKNSDNTNAQPESAKPTSTTQTEKETEQEQKTQEDPKPTSSNSNSNEAATQKVPTNPSQEMPHTGPSGALIIFAGATLSGTIAHGLHIRRKQEN